MTRLTLVTLTAALPLAEEGFDVQPATASSAASAAASDAVA